MNSRVRVWTVTLTSETIVNIDVICISHSYVHICAYICVCVLYAVIISIIYGYAHTQLTQLCLKHEIHDWTEEGKRSHPKGSSFLDLQRIVVILPKFELSSLTLGTLLSCGNTVAMMERWKNSNKPRLARVEREYTQFPFYVRATPAASLASYSWQCLY